MYIRPITHSLSDMANGLLEWDVKGIISPKEWVRNVSFAGGRKTFFAGNGVFVEEFSRMEACSKEKACCSK